MIYTIRCSRPIETIFSIFVLKPYTCGVPACRESGFIGWWYKFRAQLWVLTMYNIGLLYIELVTGTCIIYKAWGVDSVTSYDIVHCKVQLGTTFFSRIVLPLWLKSVLERHDTAQVQLVIFACLAKVSILILYQRLIQVCGQRRGWQEAAKMLLCN